MNKEVNKKIKKDVKKQVNIKSNNKTYQLRDFLYSGALRVCRSLEAA